MRTTMIGMVLALLVAGPAPAQTPGGRERARQALPPELFTLVDRAATEAAAAGLPVEPLWDKALEGTAKHVAPQRIAGAVSEYAGRLEAARGALGGSPSGAAVVAGADALLRGVPATALGRLGAEPARAPMALVVLADLVETGVSSERALGVVQEALARRAADEDMLGLAARVRAAMREGQSAGAAAEAVRRALRDGGPRRPLGDGRTPGPPAPPGSEPITRDRDPGRGGG